MGVRFPGDTNQHYFFNVVVISANFHCLELFTAIFPFTRLMGFKVTVTNKTEELGQTGVSAPTVRWMNYLKIGGGATGPCWHLNWWVLSVWAWELGVWKEEFRVLLPSGCAVSEAEWCDYDGSGWVTQSVVWFGAHPSPGHVLSAHWGEIKVLLLSSLLRTLKQSSSYSLTWRQVVSVWVRCLWSWRELLWFDDVS